MDRKGKLQCRLWWPKHLHFQHSDLLFGWASRYSESVDLVVAAAGSNALIKSSLSDPFLQAMLRCVTERLPTELQAGVKFSLIGECVSPFSKQGTENHKVSLTSTGLTPSNCEDSRPIDSCFCSQEEPGCSKAGNELLFKSDRSRRCRSDGNMRGLLRPRNGFRSCEELNINNFNRAIMGSDAWIELSTFPVVLSKSYPDIIPQLHTLRVQGSLCIPDFHLILYEQPKLGSHHFSIRPWTFITFANPAQEEQMERRHHQRADWVLELERRQEAPDIDLVVLQLNCAGAAELSVKHLVDFLDTPCKRLSLSSIFTALYRHLVAATIALLATLYYIFVQSGSFLLKV